MDGSGAPEMSEHALDGSYEYSSVTRKGNREFVEKNVQGEAPELNDGRRHRRADGIAVSGCSRPRQRHDASFMADPNLARAQDRDAGPRQPGGLSAHRIKAR